MLAFAISSSAEAANITLPPVPTELMEYIEMAEMGTLPDPLDPDKLVIWSGGGERFTFLERAEDNGGKFSLFDVFVPPNLGPPQHFHTREHEWFYVAEGNVFLQVGDELTIGEPGTLVYGPATIVHAFKNKTSEPARMLLYYDPVPAGDPVSVGSIERFFIDVGYDLGEDPETPPEIDIPRLLQVGTSQYGLTFPKTFGFAASQFTGNEINIRRTGIPDEAGSVVLDLGIGLDISVDFDIGDVFKTVLLPSDLGNQTLNLTLKDPSQGSFISLIDEQAVRASTPESSSPLGILAFGLLGSVLMFISKQKKLSFNSSNVSKQKFFNLGKFSQVKTKA